MPTPALEDIPRLYADDPQAGLAEIRKHCPNVVPVEWREPQMPSVSTTVSAYDKLRHEAIVRWLEANCVNAGADPKRFGMSPVNPVKIALSGARVSPVDDAEKPVSMRINAGDRLIANLKARKQRDS